jgi:hypothetical protein
MTNIVNTRPFYFPQFQKVEGFEFEWLSLTSLKVKAGKCLDDTETWGIEIAEDTILDATVNGVDGLDTGSLEAAKTYSIFVIASQTNRKRPRILMSLNSATPYVPEDYDLWKRVGFWRTDGSAEFWKIYQSGNGLRRMYKYNALLNLLSGGTGTSLTAVDVSPAVPAIDNIEIGLKLSFTPNTAGNTANIIPFGGDDVATTGISGVVAAQPQVGQIVTFAKLDSGVPKIEYKVTEATDSLTIDADYYIDNL